MKRGAFQRDQQGQAMVELALVLPVLLMLIFGIMQFGIAFNNYLALTDAVRAGARTAAVSRHASDPAGTTAAKVKSAAVNLDASKLQITVTSTWAAGSDVTVTAKYPYSVKVPIIGKLLSKSGYLTSTTVERVE